MLIRARTLRYGTALGASVLGALLLTACAGSDLPETDPVAASAERAAVVQYQAATSHHGIEVDTATFYPDCAVVTLSDKASPLGLVSLAMSRRPAGWQIARIGFDNAGQFDVDDVGGSEQACREVLARSGYLWNPKAPLMTPTTSGG